MIYCLKLFFLYEGYMVYKCRILYRLRGSIHTQLATRNVNLTFVGVWVIFFDVSPVAK